MHESRYTQPKGVISVRSQKKLNISILPRTLSIGFLIQKGIQSYIGAPGMLISPWPAGPYFTVFYLPQLSALSAAVPLFVFPTRGRRLSPLRVLSCALAPSPSRKIRARDFASLPPNVLCELVALTAPRHGSWMQRANSRLRNSLATSFYKNPTRPRMLARVAYLIHNRTRAPLNRDKH